VIHGVEYQTQHRPQGLRTLEIHRLTLRNLPPTNKMSTSGDSSALSSDQAVLWTPRDWIKWIALIRSKARQHDIWD